MKMGFKYIAPLCLVLVMETTEHCFAQTLTEPESKVISELMERWIENTESTVDYTDLQDQLEYYIKHKINLNKVDRFQLEQLVLLNDIAINAILEHREKFGDFMSVYELQTIEAIDERTLYYLSWFVKVDEDLYLDHTPFVERIRKGKHVVMVLRDQDREERAGYNSQLKEQGKSYYLGSPERYVFRYRFNYSNKLSFGYSGEKDMGEQFISDGKGFDFNSAHFVMRDLGHWKTIAVGDYQAAFGQGLTFGTGLSAGKSAYVLNVRKSFLPIRPYRSLNENEFLRGAAISYGIRKIELTIFGSFKKVSTNYQQFTDSLNTDDGSFSSIQQSGLHRTQIEIANRNNINQTIAGGHAMYKGKKYELGFTAVKAQYNMLFAQGTAPYQLYNFNGKELSDLGIDYGVQIRNTNLFGEFARSNNGGMAGLTGLNTALHQNLDFVVLYRNYAKNYQAIYNNPFGEYGDGKNEKGIYTGFSLKPAKRWQLNGYLDWYSAPWLRYLTDAPSGGTDYLLELQYNPNKKASFYFRYRSEAKNKNQSSNLSATDYTSINKRNQYRLHAQYSVTEKLSAKTRFEYVVFRDELSGPQVGSLIFQDLNYTATNKKFSAGVRLALFNVDDYNARVYATELDVLYQYSVPLYQNSGIRYYGVFHYRISRHLDCWLKYSQTTYSNVQTIGNGLEQINGNKVRDLRIQFRFTL
jgi:hypothetical protein